MGKAAKQFEPGTVYVVRYDIDEGSWMASPWTGHGQEVPVPLADVDAFARAVDLVATGNPEVAIEFLRTFAGERCVSPPS